MTRNILLGSTIEDIRNKVGLATKRNQLLHSIKRSETDINNVKGLKKKYSLIFWAYGPSVIPIEQVWDAIYQLELMANTMVIMVPWGKYNYPEGIEVNPLDKNITEFRPIDFLKRGYAVHCMGPKDERGSNLLAWKTLWVEPWMIVHSDEEGEDE